MRLCCHVGSGRTKYWAFPSNEPPQLILWRLNHFQPLPLLSKRAYNYTETHPPRYCDQHDGLLPFPKYTHYNFPIMDGKSGFPLFFKLHISELQRLFSIVPIFSLMYLNSG